MRSKILYVKWLLASVSLLLLTSCQKTVCVTKQPVMINAIQQVFSFHVSTSAIVLLQGNENKIALSFSWAFPNAGIGTIYIIESAIHGSNFEDVVVVDSTKSQGLDEEVRYFDSKMCRLLPPGYSGKVDLRVKAVLPGAYTIPQYSEPVALDVTTYQHFITYQYPDFFRIPGNYQGWNPGTALMIVSQQKDGQYEGFINFTNQYPQVLLVKGNTWTTYNTYYNIGNNKFGFNGSILSVFGGKGAYLFRANTSTNTFDYTKINSWDIHGSAIPDNINQSYIMSEDESILSWTINIDLVKGHFRLRANASDQLSFGKASNPEFLVPDLEGADFSINKPGNYTIKLNIASAGNYMCSILTNP